MRDARVCGESAVSHELLTFAIVGLLQKQMTPDEIRGTVAIVDSESWGDTNEFAAFIRFTTEVMESALREACRHAGVEYDLL